jgi:hypothetical protein
VKFSSRDWTPSVTAWRARWVGEAILGPMPRRREVRVHGLRVTVVQQRRRGAVSEPIQRPDGQRQPQRVRRCRRTGASSAITSGASSASRRGGSGLPQGSHNGPQTPPRNRRATPLPFPMSRAGRRGRAAGRADWAAPPSCAGVAPPRVSKTTREHHG